MTSDILASDSLLFSKYTRSTCCVIVLTSRVGSKVYTTNIQRRPSRPFTHISVRSVLLPSTVSYDNCESYPTDSFILYFALIASINVFRKTYILKNSLIAIRVIYIYIVKVYDRNEQYLIKQTSRRVKFQNVKSCSELQMPILR